MNIEIENYLNKYPKEIKELFIEIRKIIYEASKDVDERLWAKIPSYYLDESFVRMIPFKDHINIEAKAIIEYKEKLGGYKITPKGMLQIYINEKMPSQILFDAIKKTLIK